MRSIEQERIVIYTAIFGNYDILIDPQTIPEKVKFICFTDNKDIKSDVWEIRYYNGNISPRLKNRKVKILPHHHLQEFDYSIYVDGNVQITGNLTELIEKYLSTHKLAVPRYPYNNCIYDEYPHFHRVYENGEPKEIETQLERYRKRGFPEDFGFPENNVIFRKHGDQEVIELMEEWWKEYQNGSKRDQVSFPFVAWANDFNFEYIEEGPRTSSSYFRLHPHRPPGTNLSLWKIFIYFSSKRDSNIGFLFCWMVARAIHILGTEGIIPLFQRSYRHLKRKNGFR